MVNKPDWASPAEPQIRPTMPTIRPIVLDRLSPCTLPLSWLPISGTWLATAFSTWVLTDGSYEAIRPRIVTSTSSNGNSDTNAEYGGVVGFPPAALAPRVCTGGSSRGNGDTDAECAWWQPGPPPLSSPYFLITPKTNAVGV